MCNSLCTRTHARTVSEHFVSPKSVVSDGLSRRTLLDRCLTLFCSRSTQQSSASKSSLTTSSPQNRAPGHASTLLPRSHSTLFSTQKRFSLWHQRCGTINQHDVISSSQACISNRTTCCHSSRTPSQQDAFSSSSSSRSAALLPSCLGEEAASENTLCGSKHQFHTLTVLHTCCCCTPSDCVACCCAPMPLHPAAC